MRYDVLADMHCAWFVLEAAMLATATLYTSSYSHSLLHGLETLLAVAAPLTSWGFVSGWARMWFT